ERVSKALAWNRGGIVADQDIYLPEGILSFSHRFPHLRLVSNVSLHEKCFATRGLDFFKHTLRVSLIFHLIDHHACPFTVKYSGDARPRAAGRAGNQRNFISEKHGSYLILPDG